MNKINYLERGAMFLIASSLCSTTLFAATNDEVMAELHRLQNRLTVVESTLGITKTQLADTQSELNTLKQTNLQIAQNSTNVSNELAPEPSESYTPEIYGRIFLDAAQIPSQSIVGKTDELMKERSKAEIRKAYLGVRGKINEKFKYNFLVDFSKNEVVFKNANVTYKANKSNKLVIGFQKPAFGLEHTTSSNNIQFMERSLTDVFAPDRNLGLSWSYYNDYITTQFGAYLPNVVNVDTDDEGLVNDDDTLRTNDANTYTARVVGIPVNKSNQLLHLGASAMYVDYHDKDNLSYNSRPESHLSSKLVKSQKIGDPSQAINYGVEAAYQQSGFLLQSEYIASSVDGLRGKYPDKTEERGTYNYSAWYFSTSYMLTGEAHSYKASKGTFGRVVPDEPFSKDGWGAFELTLRYSSIDLDYGENYKNEAQLGGKMNDITLGLNWYLEKNMRVMFNFINYDAHSYEDSTDYVESQNGNIIQTRLQIEF